MKEFIEVPQFETVREEDLMVLTQKVNDIVLDHRNEKPEVTWADGNTARISFIRRVRLFEEEQEPSATFCCDDCPFFRPLRKMNGEPDPRAKHGGCMFANLGRTRKDMPACEKLYEMIKNGMVQLRLSDEAKETMEVEA